MEMLHGNYLRLRLDPHTLSQYPECSMLYTQEGSLQWWHMSCKDERTARENHVFYSEAAVDGRSKIQVAPDPSHMLEKIMKGCLCLKRKHYSLQSMDKTSLSPEKVRGGAYL